MSSSRLPNREDGWVLVSAIVLMAIMLTVGLASFAFVDTGQKRSAESRERESSLSLAEASLYAQGFALTRNWPNPKVPLNGDCSSATALTATTLFCPDRDTLAKIYARELGDNVLVMDNGMIVHRGEMAALASDVALQERLLGLSLETHQ